MPSPRHGSLVHWLLGAFALVSVVALLSFIAIEALGIEAGLDATNPGEEEASQRVHSFFYRWGLISGAAAVGLALLVAAWLAILIVRPLKRLTTTANAFAKGDRSARADVRTGVRELDELARAFDAMADQIVASEDARFRLVAHTAHELRSPLTVISGRLEEMSEGLAAADPTSLAAVHLECQRLTRAADDLAYIAAETQPNLPVATSNVDLAQVAREAVAVRESIFRDAGLNLSWELDPITVTSDEPRLRQIIGNLLDNSLRYCAQGDRVMVRTVSASGTAWMIVDDSGPGMSTHDREHAFQHGYRGGSAVGTSGSGIGLAVVQRWAEKLGGSADIEPSAIGGLRVIVGFPTAASPETTEDATPSLSRRLRATGVAAHGLAAGTEAIR